MKTDDGAALPSKVGQRMDREAIRGVLYDDCRALDRGDAALMKACDHPDGTDDHGCFVGTGRGFADGVLPLQTQLERRIHTAGLQRLVPGSPPHEACQGRRGLADPVEPLTRLDALAHKPFRQERSRKPLRQVLLRPKALVHGLGDVIQRRPAAPQGSCS